MTTPLHRPAQVDDFDAIATINNHYIRTTSIHFGYDDVSGDELRELWRTHEDRFPWLVAELDAAVIGYAKAGTFRARQAYDWIVESGIYFTPEHCGRGYGAPLYRRLLDVLREQGFHTVIGGATMPNPGSTRLHEKLGFVHRGTVKEAGFKHGAWHDVAFWQYHLQPVGSDARPLGTPAAAWAAINGD